MGASVEVVGADAGTHLVVLLPPGTDDVMVSRLATQDGISVMPLSSCYTRPQNRGGLILGYGGVGSRQIHDGVSKPLAILKRCARS
jgi:GntR family transcriptional regulator/MocR family aminotransferase